MMAIKKLEALGFIVHSDEDEIVCRANKGADVNRPEVLSLLAELKANKSAALRYLNARASQRTIRIFSKVLNQEVTISWTGDNPTVLHVDRTAYSLTEIERLKALKPSQSALSEIHQVKKMFDGELLSDDA
jgi:hypothetical protein